MSYISPYYRSGRENETKNVDNNYMASAIQSSSSLSKTVVDCPFVMNENDYNWLQARLGGRTLRLKNADNSGLKVRSHPLAAFMTHYAYQQCYSRIKNSKRAIDIGGSYDNALNKEHHICAKMTSDREKSRYMNTSIRTHNDVLYKSLNNKRHPTICYQGAQFCSYKAPYAFSVNANYDITMQDLVRMFNKHDIVIYDIWMFLPAFLQNKMLIFETPVYRHQCIQNDVLFYFNDCSNGYSHNYKNWASYLSTNVIDTPDYRLVFEKIENISDFFNIRVTKVAKPCTGDRIFFNYNFKNIYMDEIVFVPNYLVVHNSYVSYNDSLIRAKASYVNTCITHGMKLQREAFTWSTFFTNCQAFSKSLAYNTGAQLVFEGISEINNEFQDLCVNLFIYCAIVRSNISLKITENFNKIKEGSNNSRLKDWLHDKIASWKTMFKDQGEEWLSLLDQYAYRSVNIQTLANKNEEKQFKIITNIFKTKLITPREYLFITTTQDSTNVGDDEVWDINNHKILNIVNHNKVENLNKELESKTIESKPIIINEVEKKWKAGQCAYEAVSNAMQRTNKSAIRTKVSQSCLDSFLKLSYICKGEGHETVQDINQHASDIRLLDENTTWLTVEEVFLVCYINNINVIVVYKEITYIFSFNETEPIVIKNNTGTHWYYGGKCAGYKSIVKSAQVIQYNNINLSNVPSLFREPTGEHMKKKMQELLDFIVKNDYNFVIDLTAAPGTLTQLMIEQDMAHLSFTKTGDMRFLKKKSGLQIGDYENLAMLRQKLVECHVRSNKVNLVLVVDCFIDRFDEYEILMTYGEKISLIYKIDPFNKDSVKVNEIVSNNWLYKENIIMDNTLIDSGEVYVHLTNKAIENLTDNVVDVDQVINNDHFADRYSIVVDMNDKLEDQDKFINEKFTSLWTLNVDETSHKLFCDMNKLSYIKLDKLNYDYKTFDGVAGSSKTQGVINVYKPGTDYIVSPIRPQAEDKMIQTYITALRMLESEGMQCRNIYIDEFSCMPRAAIACYQSYVQNGKIKGLYLMGDSKQIGVYDLINDNCILSQIKSAYHTVTKRCPVDIVNYLQDYVGGGFKTTSKVLKSIKFVTEINDFNVDVAIAFTQEVKQYLASEFKFKKITTVNEAQGYTYKKVFLHLDSYSMIRNLNSVESIRQIYVALSRHTNELIVYQQKEDLNIILKIEGTNIENIMQAAVIKQIEGPQVIVNDMKRERKVLDENIVVDKNTVITILETVNKTKLFGHRSDKIILPYRIPKIDGTKMVISPSLLNGNDVNVETNMITDMRYSIPYHSKDSFATVSTMISRYASTKSAKIGDHKKLLMKGLDKFVSYDEFKKNKITPEVLYKHFVDYTIELQKKLDVNAGTLIYKNVEKTTVLWGNENKYWGDFDLKIDEELDEYINSSQLQTHFYDIHYMLNSKTTMNELDKMIDDPKTHGISFTMKKQHKHDITGEKICVFKAGQGVSAWFKVMNLYFSAYSRFLTESLFKSVKENVILAFNKSDAEISDIFARYGNKYNDPEYKNMDCDFSEMDKSHTKSMLDLEVELFMMQNVPIAVIQKYVHIRTKWNSLYMTKGGIAKLTGHFMQHSGQPLTIVGNTLLNMAVMGMSYKFDNILYAAFKGDDSDIRASSFKKIDGMKTKISEEFGYKLKIQEPRVSEFIANIITPYGFYPDVLRRTVKAVTKGYESKREWEESNKNIKEVLSMVNDQNKKWMGCQLAAVHYQDSGLAITEEQVNTLFDYLVMISKTSFEKMEFLNVNQQIQYVDGYKQVN
jgi:hypothetical protein